MGHGSLYLLCLRRRSPKLSAVRWLKYFTAASLLLVAAPAHAQFPCSFTTVLGCGFVEQSKVPGRGTIVSTAREGTTALRLHTEVGDVDVAGSGLNERDDLYLVKPGTADPVVYGESVEQWWAHSIYLPDDFQYPSWHPYVLFDFHNTGVAATASMQIDFVRQPGNDAAPGRLEVLLASGVAMSPTYTRGIYDVAQKNVWYDFVHHVRWSSGADGFFFSWANDRQILNYHGPTLFAGQGVYLKLANYHLPICDPFPTCAGAPSSVIHDRLLMGPTGDAVGLPRVRAPSGLELGAP